VQALEVGRAIAVCAFPQQTTVPTASTRPKPILREGELPTCSRSPAQGQEMSVRRGDKRLTEEDERQESSGMTYGLLVWKSKRTTGHAFGPKGPRRGSVRSMCGTSDGGFSLLTFVRGISRRRRTLGNHGVRLASTKGRQKIKRAENP